MTLGQRFLHKRRVGSINPTRWCTNIDESEPICGRLLLCCRGRLLHLLHDLEDPDVAFEHLTAKVDYLFKILVGVRLVRGIFYNLSANIH